MAERIVKETTFYVRYAETDAMGIVHHANYIIFFEEGRSSYMRQRGGDFVSFERGGHYLTVTEVNARYLKAATYGQRITVRCWVEEMRSRSLTFSYEIIDADTRALLMTGWTKHICITHEGRVTTLPIEWRAWHEESDST